jgi:predicted nucleotidyltransferase
MSKIKKEHKKEVNIKVQDLELNEAYRKCLHWFFAFPTREMSLNDLSTSIGVSKTTAKIIISQLIGEGFLKKEELGKVWRISCNFEHFYNKTIKITSNLEKIYLSGIIPETYKIIPNAKAIILFGSYRKGDDNDKSDIDIAVEVFDNEALRIVRLGTISEFGYRKNVPVNLYVFSRNKVDLNLFANISNGIVLDGFLEVRP